MKVDLVIAGGGVLGITFAGAYKALQEKGIEIVRCSGTSAGSIVSSLIAAGYTATEIDDILSEVNFKMFMKKTKLSKTFLIGKGLSLVFNKGLYDSQIIEDWMDELLKRKGIKTFKDLMVNGESKLKVIAADITNQRTLILPDDLVKYNIDPLSFSVAKAVMMSCTIPFFFTPVQLKTQKNTCYIVDGGIISTFPIWIYDVDGIPKRPTIGLKIEDKTSLTKGGRNDILAYTSDIVNASINKEEMIYVRNKDFVWTILLENDGILKSTDFDLDDVEVKTLYQNGYTSTKTFLENTTYFR